MALSKAVFTRYNRLSNSNMLYSRLYKPLQLHHVSKHPDRFYNRLLNRLDVCIV